MTDLRIQATVSADGKQASAELTKLAASVGLTKQQLIEAQAASKAAAAALKEHASAAVVDAAEMARLRDALIAARTAEAALNREHAVASQSLNGVTRSSAAARASLTNLGQQVNDVATGFALGAPPAMIFAQQAGQIAFALQGAGGALKGVGTFLGGPWGIALTTALVVLSPFVGKLFEGKSAAEAATDGVVSFTEEAGLALGAFGKDASRAFEPLLEGADKALAGLRARLPDFSEALGSILRGVDAVNAFGANNLGTARTNLAGDYEAARRRQIDLERRVSFDNQLNRNSVIGTAFVDRMTDGRDENADRLRRQADEASRRAAASAKELASETRRLAEAYNPVLAAQLKYKQSLEDIAKAERLGVVSGRDAALLRRDSVPDILSQQARGARLAGLGVTPSGPVQIRSGGLAVRDTLADDAEKLGQKVGEQLKAASTAIGNEIADAFANDVATAGQLIGGAIGQGISRSLQRASGIASLLESNREGAGEEFLTAFSDVGRGAFQQLVKGIEKIFGDDGKFGKTLGRALGGAGVGGGVADLANSIGIGLSRQGSEIGGAIGGALGGLEGVTKALGDTLAKSLPIIGGVLGGLVGGLLAPKNPFADVALTSSAAGVDPRLFNQRGEGSGAQGLSLAGAFGNQLSQLASALGGEIKAGLNLGAIGFSGEKFFFNSTGGDFKAAGNQRFNSAEEAVAAAVANALSTGAIATSPRVQAVLQRYASNVNQAVAEALKVKDLEQLLEARGNPFIAAFRDFERQAKQRVDVARQNGFDLIEIEKLNAEQRAALIRDTLTGATGSARALLDDFRFGDRAGGSVRDRLGSLGGERDRLAGLVRGGDGSQLDALAEVIRQIDDLQREAFGATGEAANGRASSAALLQELIDATEARVRAAAEDAQRAATQQLGTLQSMDGTLEDIFRLSQQQLAALQAIAAGLGGSGGGGGDFALSRSVER